MATYNSGCTPPLVRRSALPALRATAFSIACGYLMISGDVSAQNAKKPPVAEDVSAVDVIAGVQDEKRKITAEIGQITAKSKTLAIEQVQAEEKRNYFDRQARAFNDSQNSQQLNQALATYKATCEGKMQYGSNIARCDNALASLKGRLAEHNKIFADYKAQFNVQDALVQQRKNALVLARARVTKLQNYLSWLTSADSKLSTALATSCENMPNDTTLEELKHRCGNVQFDSARVDLPACETEKCKALILYATPRRTQQQAIDEYKNSGKQNPTPNPLLDKSAVPAPGTHSR